MDLSKTVPMNEDEVKHILKNKGILTDQAQTFLKAQDKYQVNIIYLMNHAIIETNDLKYMDLSKTVPMNEDEVKHILKNKGILTDQAQTF